MEAKENCNADSQSVSSERVKEVVASDVPSLKERMRRLAQQQRAWENDEEVPSPVVGVVRRDRAPRPSLNPDSGQVTHMKERFSRLAEEIKGREDDFRSANRQQLLSVKSTSPARRRWHPPEQPSECPARPGSANLRSRSPSPSRAEMPNSPRGGAQGSVERPLPKPVSARKASWECQIAEAAKARLSSRSPAAPDFKCCNATPPRHPRTAERLRNELHVPALSTLPKPPGTSVCVFRRSAVDQDVRPDLKISGRLSPGKSSESSERSTSSLDVQSSVTPSVSGESNRSCERSVRKESLRKQRERQQQLKYEAGLAAIGFDVEEPASCPTSREPSLKRTNESAFKRPASSSLLSIISSSGDKSSDGRAGAFRLDAEKRAKMLNFISDAQLPFSSAIERSEGSGDEDEVLEDDEDIEVVSDVEKVSEVADSETNSLFCEEPVSLAKVGPFLDSMRLAERRASLGEETFTVVSTVSDLEDGPSGSGRGSLESEEEAPMPISHDFPEKEAPISEHADDQKEEPPERHDPETKSKMLAFMKNRKISHRDLVVDMAADALKKNPCEKSEVSRVLDEAMASLESSVDDLHETEITNVTDLSASTPLPDASPRPLRRGRRSSSWSDLRSPCLNRSAMCSPAEPEVTAGLAYSVQSYRVTEDQLKRSPPTARIYSLDLEGCGRNAAEVRPAGACSGRDPKRALSLQQLAQQQEAVILQASKALHEVLASGLNGSSQHVECSRVLAVACQKRAALLEQSLRLQSSRSGSQSGPGTSSVLTLSGVRLALKSAYLQRIKTQQLLLQNGGNSAVEQHHFLCMLRLQDGRVHATELASTGTNFGPTARDFVEIPTCLTVKDLPKGFVANLDVFGFSLTRASEAPAAAPARTPSRDIGTPRRLLQRFRSSRTPVKAQPGGTSTPGWTPHGGFTHLSSVRLTAESMSQSVFPLMKLPALSPLEGILQVRLRLTSEPRIDHRGFLNVFAEVGGFGSWFRRWCALRREQLLMWNYPEEEANGRSAISVINLRQCLTRRVEALSREQCARPCTMQLLVLRGAKPGETSNLVLRRHTDLVVEKFLLSAESRKEMQEWADQLSECIFMLRQWHAEQYRQLDQKAQGLALP